MKKTFYIEGMTCASCVSHVDKSVRKVKGVEDVNVSLLTNSMEVDYTCRDNDIIKAVDNAGYKAFLNKTKEKKDHSDHFAFFSGSHCNSYSDRLESVYGKNSCCRGQRTLFG